MRRWSRSRSTAAVYGAQRISNVMGGEAKARVLRPCSENLRISVVAGLIPFFKAGVADLKIRNPANVFGDSSLATGENNKKRTPRYKSSEILPHVTRA